MGPTITCGIIVLDTPGGVVRDVVSPSPVPAQGGLSSKRRSVGLNYAPVVVGMTGIGPVKSIRRLCAIRHINASKGYITERVFTSGIGPTVFWNLSLKEAFSEESRKAND